MRGRKVWRQVNDFLDRFDLRKTATENIKALHSLHVSIPGSSNVISDGV